MSLDIKNLEVSVEDKKILKGLALAVKPGQIHILMGPNGSGKSTLAQAIMGNPLYKVNSGRLTVNGKDIKKLTPDKRAKLGIFLAFQYPIEIPGVSLFNVLRKSVTGRQSQESRKKPKPGPWSLGTGDLKAFRQELLEHAASLKLSGDFLSRSVNEGFSGGEKKRSEILQMLALKPKLVILDEIDSGLDVDGLKLVAQAIKKFTKENPQSSIILITHYARILKHLKPDFVHVMRDGKIVKSGKGNLAQRIEEKGYEAWPTAQ